MCGVSQGQQISHSSDRREMTESQLQDLAKCRWEAVMITVRMYVVCMRANYAG